MRRSRPIKAPLARQSNARAAIGRGFRVVTGSQMSPSLVRPARYPHDRARAVFGYAPSYSLEAAMADIARFSRAGFS
jgi:nucleoside-diphosphate-sugar epimerase